MPGVSDNDYFEFLEDCIGCLPFTKIFQKIRLEYKWNTISWVVPEKKFQEKRNFEKIVPFSRLGHASFMTISGPLALIAVPNVRIS